MQTVVDARDGRVLYRFDLSSDAFGPSPSHVTAPWMARAATRQLAGVRATAKAGSKGKGSSGLAFEYFPGHKPGGTAQKVNYTKRGWLSGKAKILYGNNSHAYSDVNDDNKPNPSEEVHASSPHKWNYRLKPFHLTTHGFDKFCDNPWPCSWNPNKPNSWKVNRAQNTAQVFFFVNNWHDHLRAAPIGFTEAAGNFQRQNSTASGVGHDAVQTQTDDGANTANGLPDGNHIDNANMSTPPDGHAPRMQMYLQHSPGTRYPGGDPFSPTNVGDEADTVYHEYTHGLSNRLVVDADGNSTLGGVQAGAMGEAWSDWYAMDYLVAHKLEKDVAGVIDVSCSSTTAPACSSTGPSRWTARSASRSRAASAARRVATTATPTPTTATSSASPRCTPTARSGRQTLWDLRHKLGSKTAESLVTRGMSIAANNPSFLDMRNAILLADLATRGGSDQDAIWQVFAHRGMGYFAGSLGGNDTTPGADSALPPTGGATGRISGTVTDSQTGDPIEGAVVTVAFQGSPFITNPSDTTGGSGNYAIGPIPQGSYPKVVLSAPGYDSVVDSVDVDGQVTLDASLDRDWVSLSGGATIVDHTGPNFGGGFNFKSLTDQSLATSWVTTADLDNTGQATPDTPKQVTIQLPQAIDISQVIVDPTTIAVLGLSSSTGAFHIEVSDDGTGYVPLADGEFVAADRGHFNDINLTGDTTNVSYIRYWIDAPMVLIDTATYPDGCSDPTLFDGCTYESSTEMEVYGTPAT